jgi:hypothetical protein
MGGRIDHLAKWQRVPSYLPPPTFLEQSRPSNSKFATKGVGRRRARDWVVVFGPREAPGPHGPNEPHASRARIHDEVRIQNQ